MFDKLRALLKSNNSNDIAEALASIDIPSLEGALEIARSRRADLLLTGSKQDILAAEAVIDEARIDLDRAVAATAELSRRLEVSRAEESAAAFFGRYEAAVSVRDAAVSRIRSEYPDLARKLQALAEAEEAADKAIEEVNEELAISGVEYGRPTLRNVSHDFWHEEYVDQPTLRDSISLPPMGDLPAWGRTLGWLTRTKAFALFGIGGPVDDGIPKHQFF
ncbi:hypothetical protein [Devosia naphthalenivorans]|uniref:hypothetical protein n=1 Tax=Devosia naphthalenivorans TaxID=2082392 RepID=UPI000D3D1CF7|nr:hypothetical protein [Devosia naphthalenivorans]